MEPLKTVILSTKIVIGNGIFESVAISLEDAQAWVQANAPENFCGHATVKIVGLEPAKSRNVCTGYDQALCLAPKGGVRLENREYSLEEIQEIGVDFVLILKHFESFEQMRDYFEGRA